MTDFYFKNIDKELKSLKEKMEDYEWYQKRFHSVYNKLQDITGVAWCAMEDKEFTEERMAKILKWCEELESFMENNDN